MARGLPVEKFDFCEKVGILCASIGAKFHAEFAAPETKLNLTHVLI